MLMARRWCDGFTPIQYILTNCFLTEIINYNWELRTDEREWRGEFLHSSWEGALGPVNLEIWRDVRDFIEKLHDNDTVNTVACPDSLTVSASVLSNTNVSDWDLRYRSEPGQLQPAPVYEYWTLNSFSDCEYLILMEWKCIICPEQRDMIV